MTIYQHTAGDRTPYTYLIGWPHLNKWYYGVRYGINCHPYDLFNSSKGRNEYRTSSSYVKQYILEHGDPTITQIRQIFNTVAAALKWEHIVLRRLNVIKREEFLNKTNNKGIPNGKYYRDANNILVLRKGKSYEDIHGVEKATILRMMRSSSNTNRLPVIHTEEAKKLMSTNRTGSLNSNAKSTSILSEGKIFHFTQLKDLYKHIMQTYHITEDQTRSLIKSLTTGSALQMKHTKRFEEIRDRITII